MDGTDVCMEVQGKVGNGATVDQVMHIEDHCESGLKFLDVVTEAHCEWD